MQVLFGQSFQRTNCSDILNQIPALTISDCNILNTLFCCQQCFYNCNRMGNTRRNKCSGQGTVRLTVDGNACLLINARQPVTILPVCNGTLNRNAFCIRDIVGNAAAFIARKSCGVNNLRQKACIWRTMTNLKRYVDRVNYLAAC